MTTRRQAMGAALGMLGTGAAAMLAPTVSVAAQRPERGEPAPDFVGRNYDGERVLLSSYAGKVIVVSFWASWCVPCRKELPILEGIQQTAGKERIQVIAVNTESLDMFRRIARKMTTLQLLVAHDANGETAEAYGVAGIPHMVIVGRDGRIVRVNRGYNEDGLDRVVDDINRAMAR